MPMDFPDMNSLINAAKVHKFRAPNKGETEDEFREALADHVASRDFVESQEIRNKVGWDQWTEKQNADLLFRSALNKRR